MKISTKGRYALRAVVDLAFSYKDRPVSLKDIAKRQEISIKYLEAIFTKLVKEGILTSKRGADGGFVLRIPASKLTAKDVIIAVNGKPKLAPCTSQGFKCNKKNFTCKIENFWNSVDKDIDAIFASKTISDFL